MVDSFGTTFKTKHSIRNHLIFMVIVMKGRVGNNKHIERYIVIVSFGSRLMTINIICNGFDCYNN